MRNQHQLQPENPQASELKRARQRLLYLLSRKPHSIYETRRKLRIAGFSATTIDEIIHEATEMGWLDDQAYAKLWVHDRLSHKPKGKALLKKELREKGVAETQIETVLNDAAIDEPALIGQLVTEQMARHQNDDPANRKRKLYGYLQRRGFSPDAIRRAMENLGDANDS
ncbi:regulatory protein RecX [Candidatus Acetothermia bacterium]|nr:regulatory protein RecX [Candidatus Acetothermia bacterium]MBI3642530.1 regulatory protein RecX [Candidatus Acetothermia bacterium]